METNTEKIRILDLIGNDKVSLDEVSEAFIDLFKFLQLLKGNIDSEMVKQHSMMYAEIEKMEAELKIMMEKKIGKDECMKMMATHKQEMAEELARLEGKILSATDLTEVWEKIAAVKALIPEIKELNGNEIIVKINEGEEYIDKERVRGLEEEFKNIRKEISSRPSGGSRRVFQPKLDRFKDDCNGSNKTFYLSREPLATDTIEVSGTDFPIILDPTVDFTVSGKTLTLTSAVPAPSSGATLICKYYA